MPYIRFWIHLVWATKNRNPVLIQPMRQSVLDHIKSNAQAKQIFLDTIGGHDDHIHALIALQGDQCVATIAQLLKGESSHWVNDQKLVNEHFEWQDGYGAFSVSDSDVGRVRTYIRGQEDHHRHRSFSDEYRDFLEQHGFQEPV